MGSAGLDEPDGTMNPSVATGTVAAQGADLYFERRGSGPGLLLISGGGGDAGNYSGIAGRLADEYTVVTYDRRGNSRSPLGTDPTRLRVEEQSADALAVLEHNGLSSAAVFGSSSGAVIGLDLAARAPQAVEVLVAHEPPVIGVLDDAERWFAFFDELDRLLEDEGVGPALTKFMSSVGRSDNEVRSPALMQRLAGNWDFFARHEMRPVAEFVPDLDALRKSKVPVVFAGGHESRSYYYCRTGEVLAARLGVDFVEFPGHHMAYLDDAESFASILRQVLRTHRDPSRSPVGAPEPSPKPRGTPIA
jgi:pimeloyl-ACP methyl ester carboxylesterase